MEDPQRRVATNDNDLSTSLERGNDTNDETAGEAMEQMLLAQEQQEGEGLRERVLLGDGGEVANNDNGEGDHINDDPDFAQVDEHEDMLFFGDEAMNKEYYWAMVAK